MFYDLDKSCTENENRHFVSHNYFRKSRLLWDNVEKYSTAGQATDKNMAHALCMLDAKGYKRTLRTCNIITFPLQQWLQQNASILRNTYSASFGQWLAML